MVHREHKQGRYKAMKKFCFSLLAISIILLMVSLSFAQGSRSSPPSEGKSGYTNISVAGLSLDGSNGISNTGTPGYIEMYNTAGVPYYLYVGYDGKLRIASEEIVGLGASPSVLGWGDASAPVVGTQS